MHVADVLARQPDLAARVPLLLREPRTPFPILSAKIKLTMQCNLRCRMCTVWEQPGRLGAARCTLPPELVAGLLHDLRERGCRKVHFSGGEPTLLPHFRDVIVAARALEMQVNFTTNGTLLDRDFARFIVEQRVHAVAVSIDESSAARHDAVRGVAGAFKRTLKGIRRVQERVRRKGHGPVLAVNTVVTRENIDRLDEMHELLQEMGIRRWRLLPIDTADKRDRPTAEQWQRLAARWDDWQGMLTRLPVEWSGPSSPRRAAKGRYAGDLYDSTPCYAPWFHVFIGADGGVWPCCMGKGNIAPVGNVLRQSLDEILAGRLRSEVLCTMASGKVYDVCHRCDDFLEENQAMAACAAVGSAGQGGTT